VDDPMGDFYRWLVFIHVLAGFAFVLAHGASAAVVFRVRAERDPERVRLLLDLSRRATIPSDISILVLLIAGIWAGIDRQWFTSGTLWIWASLVALVAVFIAMWVLVSRHYYPLRQRMEQEPPITRQELDAALATPQPLWGAAIGMIGLVLLIWLMVFKPF
jgi:hypothetical protein